MLHLIPMISHLAFTIQHQPPIRSQQRTSTLLEKCDCLIISILVRKCNYSGVLVHQSITPLE